MTISNIGVHVLHFIFISSTTGQRPHEDRAVPSSPPLNFRASSPESTRIRIMWDSPLPDNNNGSVEGYLIHYGIKDDPTVYSVSIEDKDKKEAMIEMLQPFTLYTINIRAVNDVGSGPPAWLEIKTAEGVPSKPRITNFSEMGSRALTVHWDAPLEKNGILKNYQLQWIFNNTYKTRIITSHLTNQMSAIITGLKPYTQYNVRVRAETGGGYSEYSDLMSVTTDVEGPSAPTILNVTVLTPTMIYLAWKQPEIVYKRLNMYVIRFRSHSGNVFFERQASGDVQEKILKDIPANNTYYLKIAGVTRSIFSEESFTGRFSKEVEFVLEETVTNTTALPEMSSPTIGFNNTNDYDTKSGSEEWDENEEPGLLESGDKKRSDK